MQIITKHQRGSHERYCTSPIGQNRAFSKPQQKFLLSLFPSILLVLGKVNFTNLSRYSEVSERTYRRQYRQGFAFVEFNAVGIEQAIPASVEQIASMDCSFIAKSGDKTAGIDRFYNGSSGRTEKGLEISVIAVNDVVARRAYTLSVQQTPASERSCRPPSPSNRKTVRSKRVKLHQDQIAEIQTTLQHLPVCAPLPRTRKIAIAHIPSIQAALRQLPPKASTTFLQNDTASPAAALEMTRVDHYLQQLQSTHPYFAPTLKYLVVDGFYSKRKFVDGVCALNLHQIGKLRSDANLRYLYEGLQKPRGCPRKYDGKVCFNDLTRLPSASLLDSRTVFHTAVVWHVSLQRKIRIVVLLNPRKSGKIGLAILFSTDVDLAPALIVEYYRARFQIEFIFRDAKQFTGLCDCQSRHAQTLDFHFNASLTALNLAKYQAQLHTQSLGSNSTPEPFSMASYKRIALNDHLLERFIAQLDLDPTSIKSHPNYPNLRSYGILAS